MRKYQVPLFVLATIAILFASGYANVKISMFLYDDFVTSMFDIFANLLCSILGAPLVYDLCRKSRLFARRLVGFPVVVAIVTGAYALLYNLYMGHAVHPYSIVVVWLTWFAISVCVDKLREDVGEF